MKKTLIVLLALGGVAAADSQTFTNLSQSLTLGDVTYDATTGKFTGSGITSADADGKSFGIITFAVDWNAAKKITGDSPLVELIFNSSDDTKNSGFALKYVENDTPQVSAWWGDAMNTGGSKNNDALTSSVQTINGKEYAMLSLHYERIVAGAAGDGGITVYNSEGVKSLEHWGLGSTGAGFTTVYGIQVNTNLVSAITITPGVANWDEDAVAVAAIPTLVQAMTVTVPEPTTATLSLLALAGLAARRRRR